MMQRLKLYPIHTFLFIPFIVVFLYAQNLGQTRPYMTYRTLWAGTLLCLFMFGVSYLFFKNRLKAGVVVTFVLFAFFQYGIVYEFFERLYYRGHWPFSNIHRYLILLYIVLLLAGVLWVKKTKQDFITINYFLNALVTLLFIFNFFRIGFGHYSDIALNEEPIENEKEEVRFAPGKNKPDVYYIILDGYAGTSVLEKYYDFNNRSFIQSLKGRGFRFCDSAFANYYYTSVSLSSTLNFDYHEGGQGSNRKLWNNRVFKTFKNNGYTICHMKSGYAVTSFFKLADKTIMIDGPNEFEKSLLKYTILRVDDLIGLFAHRRLTSQFEKMSEFVKINASPKLCFMHFVAPHPPYIFDRNGNLRAKHRFAEHSWEPKEYYVDQLVYVNKQISLLVNQLIAANPNSLIIIQSDHGPWIKGQNKEEVFEARSAILYAYYYNGSLSIPSKTSPVNTFRYIFNSVFGCKLDTLKDIPAGKESIMKDPILIKKAG